MEAIHNFRDLGGIAAQDGRRMKMGRVFRCGSLAKASENDLQALRELGIRTVCDLRTPKERKQQPDRLPAGGPVRSLHLPIKVKRVDESGFWGRLVQLVTGKTRRLDNALLMQAMYRDYVTDFSGVFREVLKLCAQEENLPLLIHCTAGKDRTGITCGMLQMALGIPPALAEEEYLRTNFQVQALQAEMLHKLRLLSLFGLPTEKLMPLFEARPAYWAAAQAQVHESYGSFDAYIEQGLGFSPAERRALADLLLEVTGSR